MLLCILENEALYNLECNGSVNQIAVERQILFHRKDLKYCISSEGLDAKDWMM